MLTVCASGLACFMKGCGRLPQGKMLSAGIACALRAVGEGACESKPLANWSCNGRILVCFVIQVFQADMVNIGLAC